MTSSAPIHTGILYINTGSPDAPTPKAVKRYLAEFLRDPRIVEKPRWFWLPILHGIILRTRPQKSARLYQNIWSMVGSPLLVNTQQLASYTTSLLHEEGHEGIQAYYAMRYGNPSVESVLDRILEDGVKRLLVVPLFPQYSPHTTVSCLDAVYQYALTHRKMPELRVINEYYDHPAYIAAIANQIREYWSTHKSAIKQGGKLLFSYHSCPTRGKELGDVYETHCRRTTELVVQALNLAPETWEICFQSRFGRDPWIGPFTQEVAVERAREGVPALDVICPGFAHDCLETLEEIGISLKESYEAHYQGVGTAHFGYIPALNAHSGALEMYMALMKPHLEGWAY